MRSFLAALLGLVLVGCNGFFTHRPHTQVRSSIEARNHAADLAAQHFDFSSKMVIGALETNDQRAALIAECNASFDGTRGLNLPAPLLADVGSFRRFCSYYDSLIGTAAERQGIETTFRSRYGYLGGSQDDVPAADRCSEWICIPNDDRSWPDAAVLLLAKAQSWYQDEAQLKQDGCYFEDALSLCALEITLLQAEIAFYQAVAYPMAARDRAGLLNHVAKPEADALQAVYNAETEAWQARAPDIDNDTGSPMTVAQYREIRDIEIRIRAGLRRLA